MNRLRQFVAELDKLLASDPEMIFPVLNLLDSTFPVTGCNIEEALDICRNFRFFKYVSNQEDYYAIVFNSRGYIRNRPGFYAQFGLRKASGDSSSPFAKVNND